MNTLKKNVGVVYEGFICCIG